MFVPLAILLLSALAAACPTCDTSNGCAEIRADNHTLTAVPAWCTDGTCTYKLTAASTQGFAVHLLTSTEFAAVSGCMLANSSLGACLPVGGQAGTCIATSQSLSFSPVWAVFACDGAETEGCAIGYTVTFQPLPDDWIYVLIGIVVVLALDGVVLALTGVVIACYVFKVPQRILCPHRTEKV